MDNIFTPLAVSALVSIGLGYPAMLFARRFRLIDVPGSAPHKAHAHPTPLAGGLLLASTFAVAAIVFRHLLTRDIFVVLAGSAVIFTFGLWDDLKG
ncbi:MAG: hypothetical protein PHQ36_11440, partial [Anaerolineales bacterium]|nr:hypothetical protein [Anaerolineales bacterium]